MSRDLYVMPLWRFKTGDFCSPIEVATGLRPKIVTWTGILRRPALFSAGEKRRARRDVEAIRKAVRAANGVDITWNETGGVVYSSQAWAVDALRTYARWLDLRDQCSEFGEPPEGDYYKHAVWELKPHKALSCPHLVEHDCYNGYYLPCDFRNLIQVEPYLIYGCWPASRSVGSSVRLRQELAFVGEHLQFPEHNKVPTDDPLRRIKEAYLQLREVAELSCQHALPIIFWS